MWIRNNFNGGWNKYSSFMKPDPKIDPDSEFSEFLGNLTKGDKNGAYDDGK
jgi:hypothetical protein